MYFKALRGCVKLDLCIIWLDFLGGEGSEIWRKSAKIEFW